MPQATVLAASGLVKTGKGRFYGCVVASGTDGTVKAWDSLTAANRVLLNTTTAAATTPLNIPIDVGIEFQTGLFITIGGTTSVTVIWD